MAEAPDVAFHRIADYLHSPCVLTAVAGRRTPTPLGAPLLLGCARSWVAASIGLRGSVSMTLQSETY